MHKILTIAGSDSGGGAGIQADLKTIAALGGFGMSVITALTAQNTLGVEGILEIPADFVEKQFAAVASDIVIDAAKTGMLMNASVVKAVAKEIRKYGIEKLVVDPVLAAKGGTILLTEEGRHAMIEELLPLALVVTPNIPEAEILTGVRISSLEDMREAAEKLRGMGPRNVLVKGGHATTEPIDVLYDGTAFYTYPAERIMTKDTHGTGCTYATAIAVGLAQGLGVPDAVRRAKDYVNTAIRFSLRIGGGHGPIDHMASVFGEMERHRCLESLKEAGAKLLAADCGNIIPEVQSNLGYALPSARDYRDVAAFPARIIKVGKKIIIPCDSAFGASRHVAAIILAAIRHDSNCRSTMNIRFTEDILRICQEEGYALAEFTRADEPAEVREKEGSSLDWATHSVLSGREDIPDCIFDRGDVGKEAMIRILGKNPLEVVEKALRITHCLERMS